MFLTLARQMTNCNISVVIPAYNVDKYIGRAIASVLSQELPPQEILVVDDGSTDSTAEVVKNYPDVKYFYKPNGGAASARNIGIANAQGDWVAFLDADDEWLPNHLQAVTSIIKKNNLVWGCGGFQSENWPIAAATTQAIASRDGDVFQNYFTTATHRVPVITSGMVLRRDILLAAGPFDESMKTGEDLDLWFNIAHTHPAIGFAWPATVIYNRRSGSLTDLVGDTYAPLVKLLNRHLGLAKELGNDAMRRFDPMARELVRAVLRRAARKGNIDIVREIAAKHTDLIHGARDRMLKVCSGAPVVLQGYNWLITLLGACKGVFARLAGRSS
jgi:glycosyltransferase involved in cell wall biosynthesis